MTKLKHNKKRNTAFLYETLVRELTKTVIGEGEHSKEVLVSMIKEHFSKNTVLSKELQLYKSLLDTDDVEPHIAEKLMFETKRQHSFLDKKQVFNEQSALISQINKNLSNGIFANFVPNYKDIATISQIFNNEDITPKRKVILEQSIVETMIKKNDLKETKEQMKPVDNLVFKSFVKNFNSEYSELYDEQQKLLNVFISSFEDGGSELNVFMNEELGRLKKDIRETLTSAEIKEDKQVKDKMESLLQLMEDYKKRPINKNMLQQVLKIQQLVKELKA